MSQILYGSMPYIAVDKVDDMVHECDVVLDDSDNRYLFIARRITKRRPDGTNVTFEPLSNVYMRLILEEFDEKNNVFIWCQKSTNRHFVMMPQEFNQMLCSGCESFDIDGSWSAIRRGIKYGIRLDENSYQN